MKYFIIILFSIFPVFSLAVEGEPDPDLVKKAEAGDIDSIVQLYGFYEKKGDSDKANDFLRKAAEKGHIPSLKLIYQQTGEVLSAGLETVLNAQLFAFTSLRRPGFGNTSLLYFNRLDYLSSERGLEESASEIRKAIINEITDGQRSTLEASTENTPSFPKNKGGDGSSLSRPPSHNMAETESTSLEIVETYMVYRLEKNEEKMNVWLGKLKGAAQKGDMFALQIVYRITGEVMSEGYMKVVNATMDSFFEADREKGIHPKMTAMQNLREVQNSVMERIKAPFVEDKEGILLDLYEVHRKSGNTKQMTFWLSKLKDIANQGNTLALKVFYHITNKVLSSGLDSAVAEQVRSAPQEETWMHPKMVYMQNRGEALENIRRFITSPLRYVRFRCPGAF